MTIKDLVAKPNFWASILLVISGLLKLTGSTLVPPIVTNVVLVIALTYTGFNLAYYLIKGGVWNSSDSFNFANQLYAFVIYLAPVVGEIFNGADWQTIYTAFQNQDFNKIIPIIGMSLFKILSSLKKPVAPTPLPEKSTPTGEV